jgi:hypothetical protein
MELYYEPNKASTVRRHAGAWTRALGSDSVSTRAGPYRLGRRNAGSQSPPGSWIRGRAGLRAKPQRWCVQTTASSDYLGRYNCSDWRLATGDWRLASGRAWSNNHDDRAGRGRASSSRVANAGAIEWPWSAGPCRSYKNSGYALERSSQCTSKQGLVSGSRVARATAPGWA